MAKPIYPARKNVVKSANIRLQTTQLSVYLREGRCLYLTIFPEQRTREVLLKYGDHTLRPCIASSQALPRIYIGEYCNSAPVESDAWRGCLEAISCNQIESEITLIKIDALYGVRHLLLTFAYPECTASHPSVNSCICSTHRHPHSIILYHTQHITFVQQPHCWVLLGRDDKQPHPA